MRIYYGMTIENGAPRTIYATITGQMDTGQYVYTEIEQDDTGAITDRLVLDHQYRRTTKYGTQLFIRL